MCEYFLSGYLSKMEDKTNFRLDQFSVLFDRHEKVFEPALQVLGLSEESLKKKPEFEFDSGDLTNLESGLLGSLKTYRPLA